MRIQNSCSTATIDGHYGGFITGDVRLDSESSAILENNYRYENQNIKFGVSDSHLLIVTSDNLNDIAWYVDSLKWSIEIWDLSELDVASNQYPRLIIG